MTAQDSILSDPLFQDGFEAPIGDVVAFAGALTEDPPIARVAAAWVDGGDADDHAASQAALGGLTLDLRHYSPIDGAGEVVWRFELDSALETALAAAIEASFVIEIVDAFGVVATETVHLIIEPDVVSTVDAETSGYADAA